MAGVIGLTRAGQYLDLLLFENNPIYKSNIITFINRFTTVCNRIQCQLKQFDNKDDVMRILSYIRHDYNMRLRREFEGKIEDKYYSLLRNYINTLTKYDFSPMTKTQIALRNE